MINENVTLAYRDLEKYLKKAYGVRWSQTAITFSHMTEKKPNFIHTRETRAIIITP
jgi:hypothetical protein